MLCICEFMNSAGCNKCSSFKEAIKRPPKENTDANQEENEGLEEAAEGSINQEKLLVLDLKQSPDEQELSSSKDEGILVELSEDNETSDALHALDLEAQKNLENCEAAGENVQEVFEELRSLQRTLFDTLLLIENEEAAVKSSLNRKNLLLGQLVAKQRQRSALNQVLSMQLDHCAAEKIKIGEEIDNHKNVLQHQGQLLRQLSIMKDEHVKQVKRTYDKLKILHQKRTELRRSLKKKSVMEK